MLIWNLGPHMREKGWTNAHQLAKAANINVATAYNVLAAGALTRIDVPTVERLADAFGVPWWHLFERIP